MIDKGEADKDSRPNDQEPVGGRRPAFQTPISVPVHKVQRNIHRASMHRTTNVQFMILVGDTASGDDAINIEGKTV
jgi:hypothetical protein